MLTLQLNTIHLTLQNSSTVQGILYKPKNKGAIYIQVMKMLVNPFLHFREKEKIRLISAP